MTDTPEPMTDAEIAEELAVRANLLEVVRFAKEVSQRPDSMTLPALLLMACAAVHAVEAYGLGETVAQNVIGVAEEGLDEFYASFLSAGSEDFPELFALLGGSH